MTLDPILSSVGPALTHFPVDMGSAPAGSLTLALEVEE